MAKQDISFPQSIPSTELDSQNVPVDSIESALVEIDTRASTTTTVLQEILAQSEDRRYTYHWGINE